MSSMLESDVYYRVYSWRHLVNATESAGLARQKVMAAYCWVNGLESPVG